jgi:hypothetical protein
MDVKHPEPISLAKRAGKWIAREASLDKSWWQQGINLRSKMAWSLI